MADSLTVYTTSWCGPCRTLKRGLDEHRIPYREINIEIDDAAADWVMSINTGNRTVPTVRFSDGSTLTNPALSAVTAKLSELAAAADALKSG